MENKVYSQEEVEEIKKQAITDNNKQMILEFAKKFDGIVSSNLLSSSKKNIFTNKFSQEVVSDYLTDPIANEQNLRKLSTVLMTLSPQYQQIINYLSSIARYIAIASPNMEKFSTTKGTVDNNKLRKEYTKIIADLNKLNIQHEFQRITSVVIREDVYYGYLFEGSNTFYIHQLDSDYCRISSITDGCFNFQFNFSYFDSNKTIKDTDISLIETYPKEFQDKYKLYLKDKRKYKWQELSEENTICIKYFEELPFNYTPYASLFSDLSDLSDYKEMAKAKAEVDNYKFIGMQIPLNKDTERTNNFAVDVDVVMQFYSMLLNNLPSGIGAFVTPTDFEDIDFGSGSNSATTTNNVKDAEDSVFSSSGISPINFGKGATTSSGLTNSNLVDSAKLFKLYRQYERWLNRKFKREYNDRFTIKMLDITIFNLQETIDSYLKLGQYGVPVKLYLSALANVNQNCERGLTYLENNILNLHEEWLPLISSHVQNNEDTNKKDIRELTDEGEKTRDNDVNNR